MSKITKETKIKDLIPEGFEFDNALPIKDLSKDRKFQTINYKKS